MNLVLLFEDDYISDTQARLSDHRLKHIQNIHRATVGDQLQVGLLDDAIGTGVITELTDSSVVLEIILNQAPPPPLPITLIVALPRPKMLKRILQTCAAMGVKKLILLNSYRVEKSYWQTPWLKTDKIREQLILGLEQAKDTVLPDVIFEKRFKPFVEDRLPAICKDRLTLVAHPRAEIPCPISVNTPTTLVIGPEGGFIDYEIEKLQQAGCQIVHLGPRILKVETAIPVLLARLFQ